MKHRVLAIDPGYDRCGVAVLEKILGKEVVVWSDCILTPRDGEFHERLAIVGMEVKRAMETYSPTHLAIESLFFNTNQKTALMVAEVRGAILFLASMNNMKIFEYSPGQVKVATTGYGKATKDQVIDMVKRLVKLPTEPKYDDEYDAVAIGLTHLASVRPSLTP
jgi:crossover junction endodeoxyribonuclease RuvC